MLLSQRGAFGLLLGLFMAAAVQAGPLAPLNPQLTLESPEASLVSAIELAREGKISESVKALETLLKAQPNFRLAQLIYADLMAARSGVRGIMADDQDPRIKELFEEARLRLDQARFKPAPDAVPNGVLQLSSEYPYILIVDLPAARMHLMRNLDGNLHTVSSRYAAIGREGFGKEVEGDLRTPVGIYHVTGWKADQTLPELYGVGALPLNYPNLWDLFKSKTGYGIWLHGVPRQTYVRAPRSSEGCVTMANEDLLWLKPYVANNWAPVILTDKLTWISKAQLQDERDIFLARIEAWRKSWAAIDTAAYLDFYGEDFSTSGQNKAQFSRHKYRVNASKKFISVDLSDISLFRYPGEPMLLAEFTVTYNSDNFRSVSKKEQYWRRDKTGQWRIFREENR